MSPFSIREEPDALVISIDEPAALNDFRSNSFRDIALRGRPDHDPSNRVALDLGSVDFLSSSGVAILVGLKRRIDGKQGKLVLFGVQPVVQDLLRIMRLTQYFTFANDETEALGTAPSRCQRCNRFRLIPSIPWLAYLISPPEVPARGWPKYGVVT